MSESTKTLKVYRCDHAGCDATTAAGSADLLTSWAKTAWRLSPGSAFCRYDYCGDHAGDVLPDSVFDHSPRGWSYA